MGSGKVSHVMKRCVVRGLVLINQIVGLLTSTSSCVKYEYLEVSIVVVSEYNMTWRHNI